MPAAPARSLIASSAAIVRAASNGSANPGGNAFDTTANPTAPGTTLGIVPAGVYRLATGAPVATPAPIVTQGASATGNLVSVLPRLEEAGINVKVIAAISEELFDHQPDVYRDAVLPPSARQDLMFVSGGTRRMWPLRNVGSQADDYSLTADWDDQWLTGGLEADVIAEAHLDKEPIFAGVKRFAEERTTRLERQRAVLESLK